MLHDRQAFDVLGIQVVEGDGDVGGSHEWEVFRERSVGDVHEYAGQRVGQDVREQPVRVDDGAPRLADAAGRGEAARSGLDQATEDVGEQVVR